MVGVTFAHWVGVSPTCKASKETLWVNGLNGRVLIAVLRKNVTAVAAARPLVPPVCNVVSQVIDQSLSSAALKVARQPLFCRADTRIYCIYTSQYINAAHAFFSECNYCGTLFRSLASRPPCLPVPPDSRAT